MSELHPQDGPEIRLPAPYARYTVQHPYAWADGDDNVMLYDTRDMTGTVYSAPWARALAEGLLLALGVDLVRVVALASDDTVPGWHMEEQMMRVRKALNLPEM